MSARNAHPSSRCRPSNFALIAIDTGILRSVDERQWAWLERALARGRGKFIMAIVGHPRFAGGYDTSIGDEKFAALYGLLTRAGVTVVMAGDTHDFEYYRQRVEEGGVAREIHHFINGGGGAYLSIGTALDFPEKPAVADAAFYPGATALHAKLEAETPLWKKPFWYWIKWVNAWPFTVEGLSGVFDFNYAPFFQSLMEVRVERRRTAWCWRSTAWTERCGGAISRPAGPWSRTGRRPMIRWNSSCDIGSIEVRCSQPTVAAFEQTKV